VLEVLLLAMLAELVFKVQVALTQYLALLQLQVVVVVVRIQV
jgi:hypothetical protein